MFKQAIQLQKDGLELQAFYLGPDLVVILTGGDAHLGAVAVGVCYGPQRQKSNASLLSLPGHKEDVLIFPLARKLSKALQTNVCLMAGIHFERLSPEQIMDIVQKTEQLVDDLIALLKQK